MKIEKTYTKKIGADRAIGSMSKHLGALAGVAITFETVKTDAGEWFVRATIIDAAEVDLDYLRQRCGEIILPAAPEDVSTKPASKSKQKKTKPCDLTADDFNGDAEMQAIIAKGNGGGDQPPAELVQACRDSSEHSALSASEKAAANRKAARLSKRQAITPPPAEDPSAHDAEMTAAAERKPSLIEMADAAAVVAEYAALTPKTRNEAIEVGRKLFGAEAIEGTDFVIVTTARGEFTAVKPEIAATLVRTARMVLTAEERQAQTNRKRIALDARPKRERGDGSKPVGMQAVIAEMCMRPEGATPKQLGEATKWRGVPWKWLIGNNPKLTGIADRFGYAFEARKGKGKEVTYFLRAPDATLKTAAPATDKQESAAAAA